MIQPNKGVKQKRGDLGIRKEKIVHKRGARKVLEGSYAASLEEDGGLQ